jgi:hypothetical protein
MSPSNSKEKPHVDVVPKEFDIKQSETNVMSKAYIARKWEMMMNGLICSTLKMCLPVFGKSKNQLKQEKVKPNWIIH